MIYVRIVLGDDFGIEILDDHGPEHMVALLWTELDGLIEQLQLSRANIEKFKAALEEDE